MLQYGHSAYTVRFRTRSGSVSASCPSPFRRAGERGACAGEVGTSQVGRGGPPSPPWRPGPHGPHGAGANRKNRRARPGCGWGPGWGGGPRAAAAGAGAAPADGVALWGRRGVSLGTRAVVDGAQTSTGTILTYYNYSRIKTNKHTAPAARLLRLLSLLRLLRRNFLAFGLFRTRDAFLRLLGGLPPAGSSSI